MSLRQRRAEVRAMVMAVLMTMGCQTVLVSSAKAAPFNFDLRVDPAYFKQVDWTLAGQLDNGEYFSGEFSYDRKMGRVVGPVKVASGTKLFDSVVFSGVQRVHFSETPGAMHEAPYFAVFMNYGFDRPGNFDLYNWKSNLYGGEATVDGGKFYGTSGSQTTGSYTAPVSGYIRSKPLENFILVQGVDDEVAALNDLKSQYGKESQKWKRVDESIQTVIPLGEMDEADIAAATRDRSVNIIRRLNSKKESFFSGITSPLEYFGMGVKTVSKGAAGVFSELANDPPDAGFSLVIPASRDVLYFGFAEKFGVEYSKADDAFKAIGRGLEGYERLLITLERIQGAAMVEDMQALKIQSEAAKAMLNEIEISFEQGLASLAELRANIGASDPAFALVFHELTELLASARTSVVVRQASPVPDASAALLFASGVCVLFVARGRSRNSAVSQTG